MLVQGPKVLKTSWKTDSMLSAENLQKNKHTFIDDNGIVHRAEVEIGEASKQHRKCENQVKRACSNGLYVKAMLAGLSKLGCKMGLEEKNIVCEPCVPKLFAAFDLDRKQIVVCENSLYNQKYMDDVLMHELVHAYDVCRAKFDRNNLDHLACTSIRVANLTGDCFFWKENFLRFRFGWKGQQKNCARNLAVKNMMASKKITEEEALRAVERVFDSCYYDHEPFPRIPP